MLLQKLHRFPSIPSSHHLSITKSYCTARGQMTSEKKRKAQAELNGQPSPKRPPTAATNSKITVRYLGNSDLAKPVIGILSSLHNGESRTTDWPKRLLLARRYLQTLSSRPSPNPREMYQNYSFTAPTTPRLTSLLPKVVHLPITTLSTMLQSTTPFRVSWTSRRLRK